MLQAQDHGEKTSTGCIAQHNVLLALGSNLASTYGEPADNVLLAMEKIEALGGKIIAASPLYATPSFPPGNGADFVNAALHVSATWTVEEALTNCHQIEAALERKRAQRWGARTLDVDLIGHDDAICPDAQTHQHWRALSLEAQQRETPDQLVVPHPRVQERAFVLVPLADVAPDWVHPILGKTVKQMLAALDPADVAAVKPLQ